MGTMATAWVRAHGEGSGLVADEDAEEALDRIVESVVHHERLGNGSVQPVCNRREQTDFDRPV
jgi:hypothetical protein